VGSDGDSLDDLRGNNFTGSAPGCETVEDDDFVLEGFAEGVFAVGNVSYSSACHCGGGIEAHDSILWTPILTVLV
jgi:hypothetical protein